MRQAHSFSPATTMRGKHAMREIPCSRENGCLREVSPRRSLTTAGISKSTSVRILESDGGLQQTEFFDRSQFKDDISFNCLAMIKKMEVNGAFDEAQSELEQILVHKAIAPFQRGMACLLLAELFNKWGAASASYTIGIMERGSKYASDAVQFFSAEMDEYCEKNGDSADERPLRQLLREALYWKALNFASVVRLGGCARYSLDSALREADDALRALQNMCGVKSSHSERASALQNGHFTVEECQGKTHAELWQQCLNMYLESYRKLLSASRAQLNDQKIKTVTMIAVCNKLLGRREDAIDWATKEVDMRVGLFGHKHPRTQRAQEMLHDLLGPSRPAESVGTCVPSPDLATETGDRTEVKEYALDHVASHELVWDLDPFTLSDSFRIAAVLRMFEALGLVARFSIPIEKLRALVVKCRDSYHSDNAFHNWCHAWSVTHVAYMLLSSCPIRRFLREEEVLSVMVACLVHDIHHPGVNSDYLIKSGSALALEFPYTNVLEQMHWSHAKLMFADNCETNILENVTPREKDEILQLVYDGIMATDMQNHKAIVDSLARHAQMLAADGNGPDEEDVEEGKEDKAIVSRAPVYDIEKKEDRRELLQAIVHAADLSGQTLDKGIAYSFGRGVLQEFHAQSQLERVEKLAATSFMKNLHLPLMQAKAQLGFLNFVVEPLWGYLGVIFPEVKERHKAVVDRLNEIDFERLHEWGGRCDTLEEEAACLDENC